MRRTVVVISIVLTLLAAGGYGWSWMHDRGYS
jgi:hypothetical protein